MYIFLSRIETAGELGSPGWSIMKILGSNSLSALLSGVGWVEFLFFLVWYRFTIDITLLLGKCFWTNYAVNPGNDWKYYFLIASVQFYWTGMKYSAWIYLTRSGKFVVCPILLDSLVGSPWSFCFPICLLWRGTCQSPFWWSLHNFMILLTLLVMLTLCLSRISLHHALHNFLIDIRDMCEMPGNKRASLPLYGNWCNDNVHNMFDGILLPHDYETKKIDIFCVHFRGYRLAWCML